MNYIYEEVELTAYHPQWPKLKGYKLKNIKTDKFEFAMYLKKEDAIFYMNLKNLYENE